MKLTINADGGCSPNPGQGRYGFVARDDRGVLVQAVSMPIGYGTNNIAEWRALIAALGYALTAAAERVVIRMDSRLVVEQANKRWRVKDAKLKPLAAEATVLWNELRQLPCSIRLEWVPREQNTDADALT